MYACKLTGFRGKAMWDLSKPGSQPRRCVNIERANQEFGWEPKVSLEEGLRRTIKWYEEEIIKPAYSTVLS